MFLPSFLVLQTLEMDENIWPTLYLGDFWILQLSAQRMNGFLIARISRDPYNQYIQVGEIGKMQGIKHSDLLLKGG